MQGTIPLHSGYPRFCQQRQLRRSSVVSHATVKGNQHRYRLVTAKSKPRDAGDFHQTSAQDAVSHESSSSSHKPINLDAEITSIALPMLVALATDPLAGLVDTALIGRIGATCCPLVHNVNVNERSKRYWQGNATIWTEGRSLFHRTSKSVGWLSLLAGTGAVELAGLGVGLSIFNTITKFLTVPLVSATTTSIAQALGAEEAAKQTTSPASTIQTASTTTTVSSTAVSAETNQPTGSSQPGLVANSASAALLIAAVFGVCEAVAIAAFGSKAITAWGLAAGSPAHSHGAAFLAVRALSVPFTVLMLTLQGIFRGLQDTRTPLAASLTANILNILLAPLLIFVAGMGVAGAAVAVGLSQIVPTVYLLVRLSKRVAFWQASTSAVQHLFELLKPSGLLLLRTASITATFALATSAMAHSGPQFAAAHQVALSVWLATSLLADALAVAAQALLARYAAAGNTQLACQAAGRCVTLAAGLGGVMAVIVGLGSQSIPRIFSSDPAVVALIERLMPLLVITQPINALAFVWDGVLFGAGGFKFASVAMAACALPACTLIYLGRQNFPPTTSMLWVWSGLGLIMLLRAISIAVPWSMKIGPFKKLKEV